MRILFIGDIVGSGGRQAVNAFVPRLIDEYAIDFCVANGENMAAGNGFSASCLRELKDSMVDVFTGGDHTWDQKGFSDEILNFPNVIRPANVSSRQPGRGYGVFTARNGLKVGVISLLGRTFMGLPSNCPFEKAEELVGNIRTETPFIIVDFHAEATSDKVCMGYFLDGKVSAVFGTHTHVPTADEQLLPAGTAFQSDVGMVGARHSVLGRDVQMVLGRYLTGMPARFPVVNEGVRLHGTLLTVGDDGLATAVQRIVRDLE